MMPGEIQCIARDVAARTPCNFLVFGVGNDSQYWHALNGGGRTVFLEDSHDWMQRVVQRNPALDVRLVSYATRRSEWRNMLGSHRDGELVMPRDVEGDSWDVVLVDAPRSDRNSAPGRMQSIAAAAKLVSAGGSIFVHDCHRALERAYCDFYFGNGRLVHRGWRLRHYSAPLQEARLR
jgi:glucuronoxylan 4-O-methyltransferase